MRDDQSSLLAAAIKAEKVNRARWIPAARLVLPAPLTKTEQAMKPRPKRPENWTRFAYYLRDEETPVTELARQIVKDICAYYGFGDESNSIIDRLDAGKRHEALEVFAFLPWPIRKRGKKKGYHWQG